MHWWGTAVFFSKLSSDFLEKYWLGQKVRSGFSVKRDRETRRNFSANPIKLPSFGNFSCLTFSSFQLWPSVPYHCESGRVYVTWCPRIWKRRDSLYITNIKERKLGSKWGRESQWGRLKVWHSSVLPSAGSSSWQLESTGAVRGSCVRCQSILPLQKEKWSW